MDNLISIRESQDIQRRNYFEEYFGWLLFLNIKQFLFSHDFASARNLVFEVVKILVFI